MTPDAKLAYLQRELAQTDLRLEMLYHEAERGRARRDLILESATPQGVALLAEIESHAAVYSAEAEQLNLQNRQTWQRLIDEHLARHGGASPKGASRWQ